MTHRHVIVFLAMVLTSGCGLFTPPDTGNEADCVSSVLDGDGVDNDGDGIIDEGCACNFDGLEQGVCALGVTDQDTSMCREPSNYYAVEIYLCDGLDNDCDGLIDQGCRCEAMGTNVGVCALGRVEVSSGACIDSPLLQAQENQCDGYDNDCDGATDEDCQICAFQDSMVGVCAFGVISAQGVCAPPLAYIKDEDDQCAQDPLAGDGVDNDCDGIIDEGCACDYQGLNIGVCSLGRRVDAQTCGAPIAHEPDEASCDGLDNDCDGLVDEGCASSSAPRPEQNTCGTLPETCDGLDNNCNGIIDEGCAMQCVPTSPTELCGDGVDNDCNGQAEEGCMGPVQELFVDLHHTCAITQNDGSVWCWGWNAMSSQASPAHLEPRRIDSLTGVQTMGTGGSHDCAVAADGTVWCWGRNDYGQLGNGTQDASETPVQVQGLIDVTSLALGPFHSCAIKSDETLWCWGWNLDGQLGDGTTTNRNTPVRVQGWTDVEDVKMTEYRTCVRRRVDAGSVWCMGENNKGLLGDGTESADRTTPVQAVGLTGVTDFILGPGFACALASGQSVWCWGRNGRGEVGDGSTNDRNRPVQVVGLMNPTGLVLGAEDECIISGDGPDSGWSCNGSTQTMCAETMQGVSCWGRNDQGQLGRGTLTMFEPTAAAVSMATDLSSLSTDRYETCGIDPQKNVWCWGLVPGEGAQPVPVQEQGLVNIVAMGMGRSHACALDADGGVWCWGGNAHGQLGDGTITTRHEPAKIN